MRLRFLALAVAVVCAPIGCGGTDFDPGFLEEEDTGAEADGAGADGSDVALDGGDETSPGDSGSDGTTSDTSDDGGTDSGTGTDSGSDATSSDSGSDSSPGDTSTGDTAPGDTGGGDTGGGDTGSGDTGSVDSGSDAPLDGCVPTGPEICDGIDNNCDGKVDEGDPGGGVACGTSVGSCISKTKCIGGAVVCIGTFVGPAPYGAATNPGTSTKPVSTIAAAMANAALIGGGDDICLCDDPTVGGPTTWTEKVKMVEGTSIIGGFRCDTWARAIATNVTRIQDTDAIGVELPAGLTSITALDGVTVLGATAVSGTTSAITVTDSSPTIVDVTGIGGSAPTSIGLRITKSSGSSSPAVTRGSYSAFASSGGTQTAISIESTTPKLSSVTASNASSSGVATAKTSVGIRCMDCGGTTIDAGSGNGGIATDFVAGLWATGNVGGLVQTSTSNFAGGNATTGSSPIGRGVFLDTCTGTASFTGGNMVGGYGSKGLRIGLDAVGSSCKATVSSFGIYGCEASESCIGVRNDGAVVSVTASRIGGAPGAGTLLATGVQCINNGCGPFTSNTIDAGNVTGGTGQGIGAEIDGASPAFDMNVISAPTCSSPGGVLPAGPFYGMKLRRTLSVVTNNVLRDRGCAQKLDVLRFENESTGIVLFDPKVVNNTIDYVTCTGCSERHGFGFTALAGASKAGTFRNNIFRNSAAGGKSNPVYQYDSNADLLAFTHNDLWDSNGATQGLFYYHGTTPLLTIALVNSTVPGASSNISVDPMLDVTWHIAAGSLCKDVGTATDAPDHDRDSEKRPNGAGYDIGSDERYP